MQARERCLLTVVMITTVVIVQHLLFAGVLFIWTPSGTAFSPIAPFQHQKRAGAAETVTTKTVAKTFVLWNIPGVNDLESKMNEAREQHLARKENVKEDEDHAQHMAAAKRNAKDPIKLVLAGAPASGKGTQCNLLAQRYNIVHLSTGDMLRAAVADQTHVGKQAKEFMDAGKLVPDNVVIGIVKDRVAQDDCQKNGWLLDGFPRTRSQAMAMMEAGIVPDCFLFLKVPDEDLVERVVGRRMDPETGAIYHLKFNPPTSPEVASRLVQRSDDTKEKVVVRLQEFNSNIGAVKSCFDSSICADVDGTSEPLQVAHRLCNAITSTVKLPV